MAAAAVAVRAAAEPSGADAKRPIAGRAFLKPRAAAKPKTSSDANKVSLAVAARAAANARLLVALVQAMNALVPPVQPTVPCAAGRGKAMPTKSPSARLRVAEKVAAETPRPVERAASTVPVLDVKAGPPLGRELLP